MFTRQTPNDDEDDEDDDDGDEDDAAFKAEQGRRETPP